MKLYRCMAVFGLLSVLLTGCAGTPSEPVAASNPNSPYIPVKSDNPPITMSGYVETSVTSQVK